MHRAAMWLNLYGCETVQHKLKNRHVYLACFWAYVGQPLNPIGWATSMIFISINPTNPRTNLWYFCQKILRVGDFENLSFYELAIWEKKIKRNFFSLIRSKISQSLFGRKDGSKFWWLSWFTARVSVRNNLLHSVSNVRKLEIVNLLEEGACFKDIWERYSTCF